MVHGFLGSCSVRSSSVTARLGGSCKISRTGLRTDEAWQQLLFSGAPGARPSEGGRACPPSPNGEHFR